MRFMKALRLVLAGAALGALLTAPLSAPVTAQTQTPYTIDAILDVTGSNAFTGEIYATSLKMYEGYLNAHGGINGRPIHFNIRDEQSNPQTAVQLAAETIAKHPVAFFGGGQTGACAAIAALVKDGPVDYCLSPGYTPDKGSYAFATAPSIKYILGAVIQYCRSHAYKRIALVSLTDATGKVSETEFTAQMDLPANKDLTLLTNQHFNPTDISISAQVAQIEALKPDIVLTFAGGTPFGTVLRNLNDAGLKIPVLTSSANINKTQLDQYKSFLPPQLIFNGPIFELGDQLRDRGIRDAANALFATYKTAGTEVSPQSGFAWDPALLIVSGLKKLGANATPQQLRDYLLGLKGFAGSNGSYDFSIGDQHGLANDSLVFVQWDGTKRTFTPVSGPGGFPLRR
jgi:branched-chain amino acid transport system substrate-binding protein